MSKQIKGRIDAWIAAAPDLLEALKAVTATEMFMPDHPQRQAAYKTARAAIAKATGGQP